MSSLVPSGENLTDWGYAAGWRLVRAMPEPLARSIAGAGARYAARGSAGLGERDDRSSVEALCRFGD